MDDVQKSQSPGSNREPQGSKEPSDGEKLLGLIETLVFTFVAVIVIFRIIGCCEIYNILESRR
jgi:hypothetical protein